MPRSSQAGGGSPPRPLEGRAEAHAPPPAVQLSHSDLLASIERVAEASARPAELSRLHTTIATEAGALIRASAAVGLLDADAQVIELRAGSGTLAAQEGAFFPADQGFAGKALEAGILVHTPDLRSEPGIFFLEQQIGGGPAAVLPLVSGRDTVGVLFVVREAEAPPFAEAELQDLEHLGRMAASGLAAAQRFSEARRSREALDAWRREQSLRAQLERYDAVANATATAYFEFDLASDQIRWSGATDLLLDLPPGQPMPLEAWLERVHLEDRHDVADVLRDSAAGSEPTRFPLRSEQNLPLLLEIHTAEPAGGPRRVGILRSHTESSLGTEAPTLSSRAILQAVRHELNNPLAIIIGELQLLQRDATLQEVSSVAQAMDTVNEAALRLSDLAARLAAAERQTESVYVTEKGGIGLRS